MLRTRALIAAAIVTTCPARAKPPSASEHCVHAYEEAQIERRSAKLLRAREHLLQCAQESCGEFLQRDCSRWLDELSLEVPSVVLSVSDGAGQPLAQVDVTIDGEPLISKLDGTAIAVDPGLHTFTFAAAGRTPITREVMILQGQQERTIAVRFRASTPPAPAPAPARVELNDEQAPSALPWVVGGAGLVGVMGFAVLGTLGLRANDELSRCWPECSHAQIDRVNTLYTAANVSLGVGLVALGSAAYLLVSGRERTAASSGAAAPVVDVRRTANGVVAELNARF